MRWSLKVLKNSSFSFSAQRKTFLYNYCPSGNSKSTKFSRQPIGALGLFWNATKQRSFWRIFKKITFLNRKFLLSLITFAQNTILRQKHPSWISYFSRKNRSITSVNVGEFYRIFTFRFSFWAAHFRMHLMNFIWKYVFLIIQDTFTAQRETKVLFLLWKFAVVWNEIEWLNDSVGMIRLKEQNKSSQDYE